MKIIVTTAGELEDEAKKQLEANIIEKSKQNKLVQQLVFQYNVSTPTSIQTKLYCRLIQTWLEASNWSLAMCLSITATNEDWMSSRNATQKFWRKKAEECHNPI